jgi:hypothetical protein
MYGSDVLKISGVISFKKFKICPVPSARKVKRFEIFFIYGRCNLLAYLSEVASFGQASGLPEYILAINP